MSMSAPDAAVPPLDRRRRSAYVLALGLLGATAALALFVWAMGLGTVWTNVFVTGCMMLSGIVSGVGLIRSGLVCAPLPYFSIGCALFFGFGAMLMIFSPEEGSRISFTADVQAQALPKVNAVNCLVGFLVMLIAGPIFVFLRPGPREGAGLRGILSAGGGFLAPLLAFSWGVSLLLWATFPPRSNAALDSLLVVLQVVPLLAMILSGAVWRTMSGQQRVAALSLAVSITLCGFLSLSKLQALLPALLFGIGLLLGGYGRGAVVVILTCGVVYFGFLAELVNFSRFNDSFDPLENSVGDRIEIVSRTAVEVHSGELSTDKGKLLLRVSVIPYQSFFMAQYDAGFPGSSFDAFWVVVIPRVLWPEKPLFAPGKDFDTAFRGFEVGNNLAISFVGEAYWNMGWWGVLLASAVVGAQLGWFTRKWILFTTFGSAHLGVFLMSPLLIRTAMQVEGDFIGGYVAQAMKTALVIILIDVIVRAYRDYHRVRLG